MELYSSGLKLTTLRANWMIIINTRILCRWILDIALEEWSMFIVVIVRGLSREDFKGKTCAEIAIDAALVSFI